MSGTGGSAMNLCALFVVLQEMRAAGVSVWLLCGTAKSHLDSIGRLLLGHVGWQDLADEDSRIQFVQVHNNMITQNAVIDQLGGGSVTLGTGTGNYRVYENWIAGNFTGGQGAGIAQIGNINIANGSAVAPRRPGPGGTC